MTERRTWPAPLNRTVSVRGGELSLREALDRVAAVAAVRVTYSDALLPLERRVCLQFEAVSLGDVLDALVRDPSVSPRVVGPELIVLALSTTSADSAPTPPLPRDATVGRSRRAAPLERVVVTGTATGGAQRPLTVAVGVVDGSELEAANASSLSLALNGAVPGVWMWQQAPTALTARYGSIRGASSFGVSYPKIYVDGIEVANPLVVTHIPPESIERVEVLRGPQGAALYGTDAISGVVQLVTRQPRSIAGAPTMSVRAEGGYLNSAFTETGAYGQDVTVAGQRGDLTRALTGTMAFSRVGAFVPEGESRQVMASGRGRVIGRNGIVEGTARLALADVAASSNPIVLETIGNTISSAVLDSLRSPRVERRLRDSLAARLQLDRTQRQSLQQFTGGVTGTLYASQRWTHRATVGVDMYALDGAAGGFTPLPSSSDSALSAAQGSAMRASARVSSAAVSTVGEWQRTITLAAEHAVLREATSNSVLVGPRQLVETSAERTEAWRQTTGLVSQLDLAWRNALFITAGARVERSAGFTAQPLTSVLPMAGVSVVRDLDGVTLKLRGAFGRGIRPPRTTVGGSALATQRLLPNPSLEPEEQVGTEAGVDVFFGRRASLQVTRFDQQASGLVQPVTVISSTGMPGPPRAGDPLNRNLAYQLQNVGAIDNSGWEMEAALRGGPFALHGSLTLLDSRVRDVRRGYTGELRIGDRMLDVPARMMGVSARWTSGGWHATVDVSRVADWIGYDRIAATAAYVTPGRPASTFVGGSLRQFWIPYDGVTRLGGTLTRDLAGGLSLQLSGQNLLDTQVGEPDNITIVPGRTLTLGLRARF
jgi:iron complex outermembrane recepter protein